MILPNIFILFLFCLGNFSYWHYTEENVQWKDRGGTVHTTKNNYNCTLCVIKMTPWMNILLCNWRMILAYNIQIVLGFIHVKIDSVCVIVSGRCSTSPCFYITSSTIYLKGKLRYIAPYKRSVSYSILCRLFTSCIISIVILIQFGTVGQFCFFGFLLEELLDVKSNWNFTPFR